MESLSGGPVLQSIPCEGIQLTVVREDMRHPLVGGNKPWKLKYNIAEAIRLGYQSVVTFGGPFSNHLLAVAHTCRQHQIESHGLVRGERPPQLNPVLQQAEAEGMHLSFISRQEYARRPSERLGGGRHFVIPEGGSNTWAVAGCREWMEQISRQIDYDFVCVPVGTGGTLAGVAAGAHPHATALGFAVVKGDLSPLAHTIRQWAGEPGRWQLLGGHAGRGYGKATPALLEFMRSLYRHYGLPLDFVYTGKMAMGIFDLARQGYFPTHSRVLMLHTGGLFSAGPARWPSL